MKEHRQSSHISSLLFWAMLCTATAVVLLAHSRKILDREAALLEVAGSMALLMFGPVAFALYLIRARHVWVGVDEARGIVVSGRHVIPWEAIERVERRRPRLRKKSGPAEMPSLKEAESGCTDWGGCGCATGIGELGAAALILLAALVAFWLIFFVLIPLLLVPVLEVFAPFGDRITIRAGACPEPGRRGRKLVLRDLHDADDFVRAVSRRVAVHER